MTAKLPPKTKYHCTICGTQLREGRYVFSTWTRHRYCSDVTACHKAAKKKK